MDLGLDSMLGSANMNMKKVILRLAYGIMLIIIYTFIYLVYLLTVGAELDGARLGDSVGIVLGSDDGFGCVEKDKISI